MTVLRTLVEIASYILCMLIIMGKPSLDPIYGIPFAPSMDGRT